MRVESARYEKIVKEKKLKVHQALHVALLPDRRF
jgi:hypothetical protein